MKERPTARDTPSELHKELCESLRFLIKESVREWENGLIKEQVEKLNLESRARLTFPPNEGKVGQDVVPDLVEIEPSILEGVPLETEVWSRRRKRGV